MSAKYRKRFWGDVSARSESAGYSIYLDDKPLRTPEQAALIVPTERVALEIVREWSEIESEIDPTKLRFTKLCNASIDGMPPQSDAVVGMLGSYIETELLCYRAESPEGLVQRQSQNWDPILDWFASAHGVSLRKTAGIIPVDQPPEALILIDAWLKQQSNFELMALHDMVLMASSIVLARAVVDTYLSPSLAWEVSRVDEDWQSEQWGVDEEALRTADVKFKDFSTACRFYSYLQV